MQQTGVSPWLSMWTQPRSTIHLLLQVNPRHGVLLLSAIYVLQSFLYFANAYSLGNSAHFGLIVASLLLLSFPLGWLWLHYSGLILFLTGRCLGGRSSALHVRAALAWSKVPFTASFIMWLLLLVNNSQTVFVQFATGTYFLFVNLITLILGIWSFFLLLQSTREIQSFTLLRAFINLCFYFIISVSIYLICLLFIFRFVSK